jgi:putative cardiolipin synthase
MIIDNRAVILGGRNLADEYFGQHETGNFRDMELLCAGTMVDKISKQFDAFWNNNWSFPAEQVLNRPPSKHDLAHYRTVLHKISLEGPDESAAQRKKHWIEAATRGATGQSILLADIPAKSNPSDHGERPNQLAHELIKWIDRAQEELILVSAYLIPTPELEAAVERAEKRGVEVRILTNSLQSNNHTAAHSAYRHHVHRLMQHGADLHEVRSHAKDRSHYMLMPIDDKKLGLHAKLMLIDRKDVFIGSANMDPRSLNLNTEIGLFIESPLLNRQLRELLETDFDKRNAWHLKITESGDTVWISDETTRDSQPADSAFQRLEDWFLGELPIEAKM